MKKRPAPNRALEGEHKKTLARPLAPVLTADAQNLTWDDLPSVPDAPEGTQSPLGLEPKRLRGKP